MLNVLLIDYEELGPMISKRLGFLPLRDKFNSKVGDVPMRAKRRCNSVPPTVFYVAVLGYLLYGRFVLNSNEPYSRL